MEGTMLPAQKRKAPASSSSPPRVKNARTEEPSCQPVDPSGRGGNSRKGESTNRAVALVPSTPRVSSGTHDEAGCQDLGQEAQAPGAAARPRTSREQDQGVLEWQTSRVVGPGPSQQAVEGGDGESVGEVTAVMGPRDDVKGNPSAGDQTSNSPALETSPAATSTSRAGASPGQSDQAKDLAGPDVTTRLDRSLPVLSGMPEVPKETASDDEKDEGERNLVITIEEGESATKKTRKKVLKREKKAKEGKSTENARPDCDIQLDDNFERALEDGAKHHNLTAINVRNILHEVITNEHVVAMMKAAIYDTEQPHLFEPKMTRSKLKEVVEKGVVPPTWNISPIKKSKESKAPQFIDIPLEEEDSSDEEYRPEEEEEDETAEEGFMESDAESTTSSPAGGRRPRSRQEVSEVLETEEDSAPVELPGAAEKEKGVGPAARHLSVETVPMGPPPLPPKTKNKPNKDSSFMEKLHAVDEELASNEVCMDSYQSFDDRLIAYRTRSKWPLNNVSLGLLEAELKAPDITADMYDQGTQDDVYWQSWMKALMNDLDYEDDEDDPEYNFLEDLDEPDMEDFRNDRAVQITKKEVNELMEELFETFQDEMGVPDVEEEGGDDDVQEQLHNTFNTPQAIRFEEPLANILNEQHRTVKAQIEQLRQRKAKQQASAAEAKPTSRRNQQPDTLFLDQRQKLQLQQQMQQHVQLLTQVHLLTSINSNLSQEAETSKLFLKELDSFAKKASELYSAKGPDFSSTFSPCNLTEALALIEEFGKSIKPHVKVPAPKDDQKMSRRFDESNYLPKEVAWILATRKVFMYPELLPHSALQPKHPKDKAWFSKGEDNLLVLGLKHFEDTDFPKPLISQYLMPPKTYHQLSVRIKNLSVSRAPDNVIKLFKKRKIVLLMPSPFTTVRPEDMCPPMEREESKLPFWLQRSLPVIHRWFEQNKDDARCGVKEPAEPGTTSLDTQHPEQAGGQGPERSGQSAAGLLLIPEGVVLLLKPKVSHLSKKELRRRKRRPSAGKPVLIHPAVKKVASKQPGPLLPSKHYVRPRPRLIQPAPSGPPLPIIHIPQAPGLPQLGVSKPSPSPWLSPCSAARKPRGRRPGRNDPKSRRPRPAIVPVPIQRAPVILTVPAGVKLVSLAGGCNMIHPLPAAIDVPAGQTLRVATMVVSPATFACPLTQPVVTPPTGSPTGAGGSAGNQTPTASGGENPLLSGDTSDQREGDSENGLASPHHAGQEPSSQSAKSKAADSVGTREGEQLKESPSPQSCHPKNVQETCSSPSEERLVKTEREDDMDVGTVEDLPEPPSARANEPSKDLEQPLSEAEAVKWSVRSESLSGTPCQEPLKTTEKRQVILDLGQELDVETPLESSASSMQQPEAGALPENPSPKGRISTTEEDKEESPSPPRQTMVEEEFAERLPEKSDEVISAEESAVSPEDLKTQMDKSDKDGQEEEEDEDFDDLTQDEEDEEVLSSASEESALSVPELQETMEKLTWLASERRLSQEGDSEEENSQEENSEPEEEEEGEGLDLLQKETDGAVGEMVAAEMRRTKFPTAHGEINARSCLRGEGQKLSGKGKASSRARAKRGRRRVSKDTSKLLLLYDEDILNNDPLREQKDMAFAQAYLSKVREALQDVPGKYEEFLRILYDFETNPDQRTAVDLYGDLCDIIQEWPQLLKDFAAFLLPEQALQCGLFEEQQAFDKSRKFLRQLEICFAENPSHYQKIIKALQSCMVCSPPDIAELKVQVWQLLKGHHHLQDEFSLFFDQLRPPASRINDFEEVNWTEDKEYEFDGFEEVVLPDLEEEDELQKMAPPPRNKKRREGQTHDKSLDLKTLKSKDSVSASVQEAWSPQPGLKDPRKGGDPMEEYPEQREDLRAPGSNSEDSSPRGTPTSGRNTCLALSASEESHLWRSLQPPRNRCCLEEGDENEGRVLQTDNEAPTSPVGSADETWSPRSEGESSETQGLEERELVVVETLSDGSYPLLNPTARGWSQESNRRREGCSCNASTPETGVREQERELVNLKDGHSHTQQAAGAQEVFEGECRVVRHMQKGSLPRCTSPGASESCDARDTPQVHRPRNASRDVSFTRLEMVSKTVAMSGSHCGGLQAGAAQWRKSTEQVAGPQAHFAMTLISDPKGEQDGEVEPVRTTSPWEMGARRDMRPEVASRLMDSVTGSTHRERCRNASDHISVKFASAGAQVRFMSCQKLADLSPMDVQQTLAHRASPKGGSQNFTEHDLSRPHTADIPSPRLWEECDGGTGETMGSRRQSPFLDTCSESALHQIESRGECTGEEDEQYRQAQAAVCAKNSRLSSTGERVVLWTRFHGDSGS
ncbi:GON-4-like protein isoform X2 [Heterodontus francisci]|uniref:GON-4-like protein isoform X2 n=1 Tax=Heterodontus francisci TaxID=7792 RepID=UPI00355C21F3